MHSETQQHEIESPDAFPFGRNWTRFLNSIDDERIRAAVDSMEHMLGADTLHERRFLDAGSGSGLFSLAAVRLGARVTSFDVDPQSVACTEELKRRFNDDEATWTITPGSLLDEGFLQGLGEFDIVYSWGVVHHTGSMWRAIDNLQHRVASGGAFWLAIYNDQGVVSRCWARIKRGYNRLPHWLRAPYVILVGGAWGSWKVSGKLAVRCLSLLTRLATFNSPIAPLKEQQPDLRLRSVRGMHWWYDLVDWIGGWPFEVARPEDVLNFLHKRGFELVTLRTCGGRLGCNEYLFRRRS